MINVRFVPLKRCIAGSKNDYIAERVPLTHIGNGIIDLFQGVASGNEFVQFEPSLLIELNVPGNIGFQPS